MSTHHCRRCRCPLVGMAQAFRYCRDCRPLAYCPDCQRHRPGNTKPGACPECAANRRARRSIQDLRNSRVPRDRREELIALYAQRAAQERPLFDEGR